MSKVSGSSPSIACESATYERLREELEKHHLNEWVVIKEDQLVSLFSSVVNAAVFASEQFGNGPYLIRQVGPITRTVSSAVRFSSAPKSVGATPHYRRGRV